jgi:pyridoxamine 5'-phosphate oxidase
VTPRSPLHRSDLDADPLRQFTTWLDEAIAAGEPQPYGMALATASAEGNPSVRWLLLRAFGPDGFVFYTNVESPKARDLSANPRAAIAFYWASTGRQVRVSGPVEALARDAAAAYFAGRPRGSQLGAWASPQSRTLVDRNALERAVADVAARFAGADVPLPPHWGGYRLVPEELELWQEGADRLHDRFRYRRVADGRWEIERLAP